MKSIDKNRADYISRINNVMDFVEKNLEKELPLEYVSKAANFSPFHFHRIFSAITGEKINSFIQRKRIEKIASLLLLGSDIPLTDLAFKYGFNSGASFSRAFKKFYGITPSVFKENSKEQYSKISKVVARMAKKL